MEGNNWYCEKCDKWLGSEDFEDGREDNSMYRKHEICGSECGMYLTYSRDLCSICFQPLTCKEYWEKSKPNWRKVFVVAHDHYDYDKENKNGIKKINHSCSTKCNAYEGCSKQFTYNSGDEELFNLLERYGSGYRWCSDCQIKKWEESENEEDKKDLKRLKEITNKDDNREREREREQNWSKRLLI